MKITQCLMQSQHAPPGFWRWGADEAVRVEGVELESGVPTRFFQSVDVFPAAWGRLDWRVQLNKITASDRAELPVFRTFYPGTEWNLNRPDYRWFLTAWFTWEGPGPGYREPAFPGPPEIDEDTVRFRISWLPKAASLDFPDAAPEPDFERPLYLRSRIDARERRRIAEAVQAHAQPRKKPDSGIISLDDIINATE